MLQSDYDLIGGQQFTVKVAKQPDGTFQASVPTAKDVSPVVSTTQNGAIAKMNDALDAYVKRNYRK